MNPDVLTAAISAGAAVITAVVALVLNQRGFTTIENRISATDSRLNAVESRLTAMDNRLSQDIRDLRNDLKQFFQIQADLDKRLGRIEDKLGIPPR
ncbi:MAG TPA: hypothetical protein VH640_18650 [Bryobacteraceae bacterium]|jgi:hypothetical protein